MVLTCGYSTEYLDTSVTSQSGNFIGGIAGANIGSVEFCSASGCYIGRRKTTTTIPGNSSASLKMWGGAVGLNAGTLKNSMAYDCVIGSNGLSSAPTNLMRVGGLVGQNSGTVVDCYQLKCGVGAYSYLGGLMGYNNGTVTRVVFADYTRGVNNGSTTYVSRCIGYSGSSAACTSVYYEASAAASSAGCNGVVAANLKGTALQSALGDTSWTYTSGQYPTLKTYSQYNG